MVSIGIDVGSAYTKYCVLEDNRIAELVSEKTAVRQQEYLAEKLKALEARWPGARIVSCGYGKANVHGLKNVNELSALAEGVFRAAGKSCAALDIGGQDTKIIVQENGRLKEFFLNDKCAAGSGMFLSSALEMVGRTFGEIDLTGKAETPPLKLSATCAVFAQSEIVGMIAENKTETEILTAVLAQILVKAKPLLNKITADRIFLTGGLSRIPGIRAFAQRILQIPCETAENGPYLAALGCAVKAQEAKV